MTLTYTDSWHSEFLISCQFSVTYVVSNNRSSGSCAILCKKLIFAVNTCHTPTKRPNWRTTPFWLSAVAYSMCSRYPPHLEAVSSVRNLSVRKALVIRDTLNKMALTPLTLYFGPSLPFASEGKCPVQAEFTTEDANLQPFYNRTGKVYAYGWSTIFTYVNFTYILIPRWQWRRRLYM
jgi:hypothetical protein